MANAITILRYPLLFGYVAMLYYGDATLRLIGVPILVLLILMDTFDGVVARARGETSLLGSALDIATDRTVELILWVVFSDLGLIPIIIPLIYITRGTVVDAVRAVGMKSGIKAFDQVQGKISRFLVASPIMRTTYGIAKAFSFSFLNLSLYARTVEASWMDAIQTLALVLSWISTIVCLARGLPVLVQGYSMLRGKEIANPQDPTS
jgi:CDP-diacylglycerol--glycerol-3-phosphate 3-phosphatidyltransferase